MERPCTILKRRSIPRPRFESSGTTRMGIRLKLLITCLKIFLKGTQTPLLATTRMENLSTPPRLPNTKTKAQVNLKNQRNLKNLRSLAKMKMAIPFTTALLWTPRLSPKTSQKSLDMTKITILSTLLLPKNLQKKSQNQKNLEKLERKLNRSAMT